MYRNINNFYLSRPNFGYAYGNPYGMTFSKQSPRVVVYSRNFAELPDTPEKKWNLIRSLGRTMTNAEGVLPPHLEEEYKPKINRLMTEGRTDGWDVPMEMVLHPERFYPDNLEWQKKNHFRQRSSDPNMNQRGNVRARSRLYAEFIDNAIKTLDIRQLRARAGLESHTEGIKDSAQTPTQSTPQSVSPTQVEEPIQSAQIPSNPQPAQPKAEEIAQPVQPQSNPQPAQPQVEEPIQSAPIPPTPQPVQPQAEAKQQSPVASGRGFRFPFFRRKEKPKSPVQTQTQTPKEAKTRPVWNGNPIQYTVETLDSIENPLGSVIKKLDSIENPMSSVIKKLDSIENPLARFFKK